ncbi:TniB family NTP-binding protein [Lentibacillus sp. N15]|uniref:TniB family NTP-binding protein n=1 Tax=Lentibacillus songyuanensis TaxID=3136161 RepID=UPI0031BAB3D3
MAKKQRLFEEDLLSKSKKEREKFFNDFTVSHTKMKQVSDELKNEIYKGSQNIIMVVGPSGVGKSRLFSATMLSVLRDMEEETEKDRSIIPISGIELPNPDLGKFNWKDFYYRVLSSLRDPLIDYKIDVSDIEKKNKKNKKTDSNNPLNANTAPELRRSIESAFFNRKTKALLIDEAQHFFKINSEKRGSSEQNQRQFNSIKSLANMSTTKIVLFGTYDLNAVFNLDGQLSRRVKEIHFPRYDYTNAEDRRYFQALLFTFQKLLPVEKEPDLKKYSEYIYENSIGCAGILKNWLQRCLSDALEREEKTITYQNLKRNVLQTKKLLTLANEAITGESYFSDNKKDKKELQTLLGTKNEKDNEKPKRKNNPKPGIRKPERDTVGLAQA